MNTKNKWLLTGFIGVYLIRLLLTQTMGLMPQDAYYYFYSENLALSYFDHPPMVAYMQYFFSLLLGKSVAAIKIADFLVTAGTLFNFYLLSKCFLNKQQAIRASCFFASTFIVTILSINTTPDVPLLFFWTLTLLVLFKAIFKKQQWCWPLAGLLMGFSFDSKYTAVFLLFSLVLFLMLSVNHRALLFSRSMIWLVLTLLLGIAPVLLWNAQNDWVSLLFQSSERASNIMKLSFRSKYFLGNLGIQFFLLIPPLFIGLLGMFYQLLRRTIKTWRLPNDQALFLLAFSLPLLGFFLIVSLFYWVKLNWMMPGYLTAIVLAGYYLNDKILSYQMGFALILHLLVFLQVIYYPIPVKSDDTWYGWEELVDQVEELQLVYPDHFLFSDDGYKTTAVLNFYLDKPVFAGNVIGKPGFQFALTYPDLTPLQGQNALYFDSDKRMKSRDQLSCPPIELEESFENVTQLEPILIVSDSGEILRKFWVYDCQNYQLD